MNLGRLVGSVGCGALLAIAPATPVTPSVAAGPGPSTAQTAPSVAAGPAQSTAPTQATIAPSLAPDRLGAKATLTLSARFAASGGGLPAPVRRAVLRLPAGLTLDVPKLRACRAASLEVEGPKACPRASRLGQGSAVTESMLGSKLVREDVALSAFLGPLDGEGDATFLVLGQGTAPVAEQLLLTGSSRLDRPPYGERLTLDVPAVELLPLGPAASMRDISLTIGARQSARSNAVIVPSHCPAGGFPFAAKLSYADGSSGEAKAALPCPRRSRRRAHAARVVALRESAHLRLTTRKGFTLNEQGSVSGTVSGTIYVHLRIVSSTRVTAEVSIYRPGGSITGYASASYRRGLRQGSFQGTLSLARGTGAYRFAKGQGLSFGGTIERSGYAIAVHVAGRASF